MESSKLPDWFTHTPQASVSACSENVKSLWIPVFSLLVIWAACLLMRYGIILYDKFMIRSESPLEEIRRPLIEEYEGVSRAQENELISRFSKSANAARNLLLMSLAATVFLSLPVFYTCKDESPGAALDWNRPPGTSPYPNDPIPGEPGDSPIGPGPGNCSTCVGCLADQTTSLLNYVFLGLSVIWLVLEYSQLHAKSSAIARSLMGISAYPLIIAMFAIGIHRWNAYRSLSKDCDL